MCSLFLAFAVCLQSHWILHNISLVGNDLCETVLDLNLRIWHVIPFRLARSTFSMMDGFVLHINMNFVIERIWAELREKIPFDI